ncbi:MAG: class I SAM-dependent methyltransferase [Acidobacteria bacterium]|nr:class I SAM-dependent methyltransferase [Acidobacteriota bacterium]
MLSRRRWLAALTPPLWPCASSPARPLDFADLPAAALPLARDLGLSESSWPSYTAAQNTSLSSRISAGTAEALTYFILQSRRFTSLPPLQPLALASLGILTPDAAVEARLAAFQTSLSQIRDARHALLVELYRQLPPDWTLAACYRHTLAFLHARLKEAKEQEAIDALYQRRGLSSDTATANTATLDAAWPHLQPAPRNALLIGPGLDLTRRENFSDDAPLAQPQLERLLSLLGPAARLDCVDVRPEVLAFLRQTKRCGFAADITTQIPAVGTYDLAVATNVLVYFDDRSLFTALAALAVSLKPGGYLLHNDSRFAAKLFGRALNLPVAHFAPVSLGRRQGVEQLDRVVLHRRPLQSF